MLLCCKNLPVLLWGPLFDRTCLNPPLPLSHVEHILSVANQRMYLLAQLKSQGLSRDALHISTATVLCVVTYALPSFAGQLSTGDKAPLEFISENFSARILLPYL